jgi:hypothetical protein
VFIVKNDPLSKLPHLPRPSTLPDASDRPVSPNNPPPPYSQHAHHQTPAVQPICWFYVYSIDYFKYTLHCE